MAYVGPFDTLAAACEARVKAGDLERRAAPDERRPGRTQLLRLPEHPRRRGRCCRRVPGTDGDVATLLTIGDVQTDAQGARVLQAEDRRRSVRSANHLGGAGVPDRPRICSPVASWISRPGPRCVAATDENGNPSAEPGLASARTTSADQPGDLLDGRDPVLERGVPVGHHRDEHRLIVDDHPARAVHDPSPGSWTQPTFACTVLPAIGQSGDSPPLLRHDARHGVLQQRVGRVVSGVQNLVQQGDDGAWRRHGMAPGNRSPTWIREEPKASSRPCSIPAGPPSAE